MAKSYRRHLASLYIALWLAPFAGAQAIDNACDNLLANRLDGEIQPASTLSTIAAKGLRLDAIHSKITNIPGRTTIDLTYEGKLAGSIQTGEAEMLDGRRYAIVDLVRVEPNFRGKGLGALLYLAAARHEHIHNQRILYRSEQVSADAIALWQRMVDRGYAEIYIEPISEVPMARMKTTTLDSVEAIDALKFVESHVRAK